MSREKQETRSMIVALKVTPSEKHRIEFVAGARGLDMSELLRVMGVSEIMEEHVRITKALAAVAA